MPKDKDWEKQLIELTANDWTNGKSFVSDLDELYETLYSMLRGERPEKNYDWESNVVINKVFQVIWTAIPYITQKIFGANPLVGVKSGDKEGAFQRESILEFWHNLNPGTDAPHTPYFSTVVMWTLRALLNGVGIMKKTWHQKLKTKSQTIQVVIPMKMDTEGNETEVAPHNKTTKQTYPEEDWPYNLIVDNKDIVCDPLLQPGQSIRQGRFVIHRAMLDLDTLYNDGSYMNLDQINPELSSVSSEHHQDHAQEKSKDGQETPPEFDIYANVEVYERVGKIPVYKKKEDKQWIPCFDKEEIFSDDIETRLMIATYVRQSGEDSSDVLIKFKDHIYDEINYIDMHIYFDPKRWQSMGEIEPIKDLQTSINDNINAGFDEMNQNLHPPVIVNKYGLWDWDTMVHAPGQKWLTGGPPKDSVYFKEATNISRDVWQKHALLDNEIQLMTVTNAMSGGAKEKTATTNVMNAQLTAGKLDFVIKMIETTGLIPSAQMDVRFAKKFAHKLTFETILGKPFKYSDWEELYRYIPAAASVKLEYQKEVEVQQDTQLLSIISAIQNPNVPKLQNAIIKNIYRNRNWDEELSGLLDENFYEPTSEAGNMQMLDRMMGSKASNEQGIQMSQQEKGVRGRAMRLAQ
ncbi:MAG: hypothetical protein E3J94_01375 [Desulfobacteraceae bacterium]|nr:MAG: hypothetical protein E3J94_01375 [Desulfobacteraceae bacterium]